MENSNENMNELDLHAAVEAILFATGRAVSSEDLAKCCGRDTGEMRAFMHEMAAEWNASARGTSILELEDSWQMCTRKDYYPQLITLELHPKKPKLTDVLLETLSVIAYRQPVTKAEIERIRGVNSDHAVNRLIEFGLTEEVGRANQPGKPILFGTTRDFLRLFGVKSSVDLPEISPLKVEDFRQEAEEEAGMADSDGEKPSGSETDSAAEEMPVISREVDGEIGVPI